MLEDQLGEEVYKVGEDLPIPLKTSLDPEAIPGKRSDSSAQQLHGTYSSRHASW